MSAIMDDLPDEILENVLSFVSPYHDLDACKLVSKKWYQAVRGVIRRKKCSINAAIKSNSIVWKFESCDKISPRHSHSACYYNGAMYMYGGSSKDNTTFNDLVALNLSTRCWKRILSGGVHPSPKAGASLCAYNNKLILYGGCASPSALTPFQPMLIFAEIHTFDIETNAWTQNVNAPTTVAYHTVTVHRNLMVKYGGLESQHGQRAVVNGKVSCLDLDTMNWSYPLVIGTSPPPSYAHSQVYIDDEHLLIIGGRNKDGSATTPGVSYLLTMGRFPWNWQCVTDKNHQWIPPRIHHHPVVRVGDLLVAFSRCITKPIEPRAAVNIPLDRVPPQQQQERNVNGRRGIFRKRIGNPLDPSFHIHVPGINRRDECKVLIAVVKDYVKSNSILRKDNMNLYVGDISDLLTEKQILWKEPRYNVGCPADRILYSLVVGHSELIMYGGLNQAGLAENLIITEQQVAFATAPQRMI